MNDENKTKLIKIFIKILKGVDKNTFDFSKDRTDFEDWDSLAHMQLVSEVESAFGITFEMDEVIEISKPEDFLLLIRKRQNG
ncbi:hypothetical protein A2160_02570 [Candidatus Beckwithbacteria bacterium RBG_13_42_9]|uniref:Carrier domain-containing protein n=1 Tax=Candidatus Beckwithbacteria bacterium RBG_13_42_9 TaxID=1797457 RepID=A0A1F5E7K3_9BACT|nr:MAG: hypothetical protein A2160_02570 [Candidatus Beckwithbacteria bacterium RBG_13_42_9]